MKKLIAYLSIAAAALTLVTSAKAFPIGVYTQPDPIQDNWILDGMVHELGNVPFPPEELITSGWMPTTYVPCPTDYHGGPNVLVTMQNLSGRNWPSVYYVADPETSLSNWDEYVGQFFPVSGSPWLAFKIDNIGLNTPLVSESMLPDNIFQAGEIWEFVIQEYVNGLGLPPSAFASVGLVAGASGGDPLSSGSIIVPEPSSIALMLLGGLALLWRRRN